MDLGAFSVSLAVKDLQASLAFYSKLGFEAVGGDGEAWTILANGSTVIGLFQGMFENNILTFNPGWVGVGQEVDGFTDVRQLRASLEQAGVGIASANTDDASEGPAHLIIADPDGNTIMIDQHR